MIETGVSFPFDPSGRQWHSPTYKIELHRNFMDSWQHAYGSSSSDNTHLWDAAVSSAGLLRISLSGYEYFPFTNGNAIDAPNRESGSLNYPSPPKALSVASDGYQFVIYGIFGTTIQRKSGVRGAGGMIWGNWTVVSNGDFELVAAVDYSRCFATLKMPSNQRQLKYFTPQNTSGNTHVIFVTAPRSIAAAPLSDNTSVCVVSVDTPGMTSVEIAGNQAQRKLYRAGGILSFVGQPAGGVSDHYTVDINERYGGGEYRENVRLARVNNRLYLTATASDRSSDTFAFRTYRVYTSVDGKFWSAGRALPNLNASYDKPMKLLRTQRKPLAVFANSIYESQPCWFMGNSQPEVDLTDRVLRYQANYGDMRQVAIEVSNHDELLPTLLGDYTVWVVRELWGMDGVGEIQVGLSEIDSVEYSAGLDEKGGYARIGKIVGRDYTMLMTDDVTAEEPVYWNSQLLGGDNFYDNTQTGHGGLAHLAPQNGAFLTRDQTLILRNNNEWCIGFSTFKSDIWNGGIEVGFRMTHHLPTERAGVVFRAVDKDNYWAAVYFKDSDRIALMYVRNGNQSIEAQGGLLGWASVIVGQWRYIQVEFFYATVIVRVSNDGFIWSDYLTYHVKGAPFQAHPSALLAERPLERGFCGVIGYGFSNFDDWEPPDFSLPPILSDVSPIERDWLVRAMETYDANLANYTPSEDLYYETFGFGIRRTFRIVRLPSGQLVRTDIVNQANDPFLPPYGKFIEWRPSAEAGKTWRAFAKDWGVSFWKIGDPDDVVFKPAFHLGERERYYDDSAVPKAIPTPDGYHKSGTTQSVPMQSRISPDRFVWAYNDSINLGDYGTKQVVRYKRDGYISDAIFAPYSNAVFFAQSQIENNRGAHGIFKLESGQFASVVNGLIFSSPSAIQPRLWLGIHIPDVKTTGIRNYSNTPIRGFIARKVREYKNKQTEQKPAEHHQIGIFDTGRFPQAVWLPLTHPSVPGTPPEGVNQYGVGFHLQTPTRENIFSDPLNGERWMFALTAHEKVMRHEPSKSTRVSQIWIIIGLVTPTTSLTSFQDYTSTSYLEIPLNAAWYVPEPLEVGQIFAGHDGLPCIAFKGRLELLKCTSNDWRTWEWVDGAPATFLPISIDSLPDAVWIQNINTLPVTETDANGVYRRAYGQTDFLFQPSWEAGSLQGNAVRMILKCVVTFPSPVDILSINSKYYAAFELGGYDEGARLIVGAKGRKGNMVIVAEYWGYYFWQSQSYYPNSNPSGIHWLVSEYPTPLKLRWGSDFPTPDSWQSIEMNSTSEDLRGDVDSSSVHLFTNITSLTVGIEITVLDQDIPIRPPHGMVGLRDIEIVYAFSGTVTEPHRASTRYRWSVEVLPEQPFDYDADISNGYDWEDDEWGEGRFIPGVQTSVHFHRLRVWDREHGKTLEDLFKMYSAYAGIQQWKFIDAIAEQNVSLVPSSVKIYQQPLTHSYKLIAEVEAPPDLEKVIVFINLRASATNRLSKTHYQIQFSSAHIMLNKYIEGRYWRGDTKVPFVGYLRVAERSRHIGSKIEVSIRTIVFRSLPEHTWLNISVWIDERLALTYLEWIKTPPETDYQIGLSSFSPVTLKSVRVPQMQEIIDSITLDPGDSVWSGLGRALAGRTINMQVRHDGSLFAWQHYPRSSAITLQPDQIEFFTHQFDRRARYTHVRLVGAYEEAEIIRANKGRHRFVEVKNPYVITRRECFRAALRALREFDESAEEVTFIMPLVPTLEIGDVISFNGIDYTIKAIEVNFEIGYAQMRVVCSKYIEDVTL